MCAALLRALPVRRKRRCTRVEVIFLLRLEILEIWIVFGVPIFWIAFCGIPDFGDHFWKCSFWSILGFDFEPPNDPTSIYLDFFGPLKSGDSPKRDPQNLRVPK